MKLGLSIEDARRESKRALRRKPNGTYSDELQAERAGRRENERAMRTGGEWRTWLTWRCAYGWGFVFANAIEAGNVRAFGTFDGMSVTDVRTHYV